MTSNASYKLLLHNSFVGAEEGEKKEKRETYGVLVWNLI